MQVEKTNETAEDTAKSRTRILANGVIARLSDSVSGFVAFPANIFEELDDVCAILKESQISVIPIDNVLVFAQNSTILSSTDACIIGDAVIKPHDVERCLYSLVTDASLLIKQAACVAEEHNVDLLNIVNDVAADRLRSIPLSNLARAEIKQLEVRKRLQKKAKKFAKAAVKGKRGKKAVKMLDKLTRKLSK